MRPIITHDDLVGAIGRIDGIVAVRGWTGRTAERSHVVHMRGGTRSSARSRARGIGEIAQIIRVMISQYFREGIATRGRSILLLDLDELDRDLLDIRFAIVPHLAEVS